MSKDNDYVFVLKSELKSSEKHFLYQSGYTYICGKVEKNDIRCRSENVENYHCTFFYNGNEVYVTDLKSKHKTYVNGHPLEPYRTKKLDLDDIICIGCSSIEDAITKDNTHVYILRKFRVADRNVGKRVSSPSETSSSQDEKTANSKTEADKVHKLEKKHSNSGSKSQSKMPKSRGKK